jgi:hypothetical protein
VRHHRTRSWALGLNQARFCRERDQVRVLVTTQIVRAASRYLRPLRTRDHAVQNLVDTSMTCRPPAECSLALFENTHGLVVEQDARHTKCYVSRGVLTRRLTSEFGERKNRAAMITATRKQLDTCFATGCYSPSWSHSLLGEFQPRVNAIEF